MLKFKGHFNWKTFLIIMVLCLMVSSIALAGEKCKKDDCWTKMFNIANCTFSTIGGNAYFSLQPGDEILLEGYDKKELVQVRIIVTGDTELVDGVLTRVITEEEWVDGERIEDSTNWYAECVETGDVYYFGEDVNIYEDGEILHDGAWRAGEDGAQAGIFMPGTFLLGSRYYQEIAEDVAMDRAEHIAMGLTVETPAGTYEDCVQIQETTPLERMAKESKFYAPGAGIIVDDNLERVTALTPDPEE